MIRNRMSVSPFSDMKIRGGETADRFRGREIRLAKHTKRPEKKMLILDLEGRHTADGALVGLSLQLIRAKRSVPAPFAFAWPREFFRVRSHVSRASIRGSLTFTVLRRGS